MAVSSESRQKGLRARALSALCSRAASDGDHTWVSFRHCLKAAGVVDGVGQYLRDLGFTQAELRAVYPVMLHVEALVYQGDLAYEESQKQRSSSSSTRLEVGNRGDPGQIRFGRRWAAGGSRGAESVLPR